MVLMYETTLSRPGEDAENLNAACSKKKKIIPFYFIVGTVLIHNMYQLILSVAQTTGEHPVIWVHP